ncbi:hypothetical protein M9H77_33140 [Catharanthus roseus]|uniref:Uncharacterized protein n=1 Tax=Catharanthus roseus TaxID=4058 RepID=A0ACB9ZI09_CATRO|nr:hypothetical protein M9H77_33140 [Catharanthus roseus]
MDAKKDLYEYELDAPSWRAGGSSNKHTIHAHPQLAFESHKQQRYSSAIAEEIEKQWGGECEEPNLFAAASLLDFLIALRTPSSPADVWTEIAKFMDGKTLVMLALTCRWFNRLLVDESIWKHACLRDLQVSDPGQVGFKWSKLYAKAFDGSHSYTFRQQEKHIDWLRIGSFLFESPVALMTESLNAPLRIPKEETVEKMLNNGCCLLENIKTGIWLADLQLVRCPVCDLNTCEGTMQVMDARHIELFLHKEYLDGNWEYELLGSHDIKKQASGACAAIFDFKHLKDQSTAEIFDFKSWVGKANDWQPKAMITLHAVAVNTNLQDNEGLHVKYHAMRAGKNGEVVSIRVSQQLL